MTILVGVDGSPESKEALRWAVAEARLRGTDLRAVHVWQYPAWLAAPQPFFGEPGVSVPAVDAAKVRTLAEERLDGVVGEIAARADDVRIEQVLLEGHPSGELIRAAASAELLVVGSRGHGGFGGLLLGSVSQACAHHAPCTVVIVRPTDRTPSET